MPIPAQRNEDRTREVLEGWLAPRLGARGPVQLTTLAGPPANGFSNETLLCDVAWDGPAGAQHASFAVRVAPTGYSLFPDAAFDTQHRVMRALAGTPVPVPTVRWVEDDPAVLGAPFFVMDRVAGRVPSDSPPYHAAGWLVDDATPQERERMWTSGFDVLADIHCLDWRALGLGFLDRPDRGRTARDQQLSYYEGFLAQIEQHEQVPAARRALAWLHRARPDDEPLALSWGDARLGNVIYGDDLEPAAVIDWEMAALAPPGMDLAWALFLDRHHSEGVGVPRLDGFPSHADTLRRYEERTGRPLPSLDYWTVFAGFRFCVIMGKLAVIFKSWNLIPADAPMAQTNTATALTETVLEEIGAPTC